MRVLSARRTSIIRDEILIPISDAASWSHYLPWRWLSSRREPDNRPVLSSYEEASGEEPDMSVWQAAQMVLRYSEYADAIAALRTADRESSQETERAGAGAGANEKEATRKKHLLQMVASLGVGAKDSTLEHFIAVQDRLKNIKEVLVQTTNLVFIVLIVLQLSSNCSNCVSARHFERYALVHDTSVHAGRLRGGCRTARSHRAAIQSLGV